MSPLPSAGLSSLSLSVSFRKGNKLTSGDSTSVFQLLSHSLCKPPRHPRCSANITRFGPQYAWNLLAFRFPFSPFCTNTLSFSGDNPVNFGLSLRGCVVVVGQAVFRQQPCLISLCETACPTPQLPGWLFPVFPGGQRKFFHSCTKYRVVVGSDRSMKMLQDAQKT